MALNQITLSMDINTGYVIPLDTTKGSSKATIKSIVACYVQAIPFVGGMSAPTAPGTTPAPSAGNQSPWYHMAANEVITLGQEFPMGGNTLYGDVIGYLRVFCKGTAGDFVVNAH